MAYYLHGKQQLKLCEKITTNIVNRILFLRTLNLHEEPFCKSKQFLVRWINEWIVTQFDKQEPLHHPNDSLSYAQIQTAGFRQVWLGAWRGTKKFPAKPCRTWKRNFCSRLCSQALQWMLKETHTITSGTAFAENLSPKLLLPFIFLFLAAKISAYLVWNLCLYLYSNGKSDYEIIFLTTAQIYTSIVHNNWSLVTVVDSDLSFVSEWAKSIFPDMPVWIMCTWF